MQYLPFTLLLLAALILTMSLAHLQHRYYMHTVNRLAAQYRQSGYVLCSGIARGRLRGAIAILVMRRDSSTIEHAEIMEGTSVLARFHIQQNLHGQAVNALAMPSLSRAAKDALQDAVRRYEQNFARSSDADTSVSLPTTAEPSPTHRIAGA